jgi:hypothetical protein
VLKALYVAASVIAVVLPASANPPVLLFNPQTDMCLQPQGGSKEQATPIVEEPCTPPGPAQVWLVVGAHFENAVSELCLDARGKAENGTPVQQWTCNEITNENWSPEVNTKGGGAPIVSNVSGTHSHCLYMPGGQEGLAAQLNVCDGSAGEAWEVRPTSTVSPRVISLGEDEAAVKIELFDLTPNEKKIDGCTTPNQVSEQSPLPGFLEVPKSSLNYTVDNGNNCPNNK